MISQDLPWWTLLVVPIKYWKLIYSIVLGVSAAVSTWIMKTRMRRRIKEDLGRTPDDRDMTSLETWMKVDEMEEKKNPGRAWVPKSSPADSKSTKQDL
jgi:hypothetical protein